MTNLGVRAFQNCNALADLTIRPGVMTIGDHAFNNCNSLTAVTLPDSLLSIGEYAFYLCISLVDLDLGSGVTGMGVNAFRDCTSLEVLEAPDSLVTIGLGAFRDCTALVSVEFGTGLENMGENVFRKCTSLESITFRGDAPYVEGSNVGNGLTATVYYYESAEGFDEGTWMGLSSQALSDPVPEPEGSDSPSEGGSNWVLYVGVLIIALLAGAYVYRTRF